MIEQIDWLGHASFRLKSTPCIYVDPWRIPAGSPTADAILITHEHYDHFSPTDIERIWTPTTQIITSQRVADLLGQEFPATVLRHWQSVNVGKANIKAIPAFTLNEHHPAVREDLGFVVALNHYDIYFAGDTDFTHELRSVRCDIAILPVSAKEGIMTITELVNFVKSLHPRYVVPSHYGLPPGGTYLDAKALETVLKGIAEVVLLPVTL